MSVVQTNFESYKNIYSERKTFLRYPADWIIRFHNMYLRPHLPTGRVLDFGCGSGNNMKFLLDQGYDVRGTDITDSVLPLCEENGVDAAAVTITSPDEITLPFDDGFDLILSNQVLYFLGQPDRIKQTCNELDRLLRPGGITFFTMMGAKNYCVAEGYAKPREDGLHELKIEGDHRLTGFHQLFHIVSDEQSLVDLFDMFEPISVGYFDQSMLTMSSNFHWIFIGRKR